MSELQNTPQLPLMPLPWPCSFMVGLVVPICSYIGFFSYVCGGFDMGIGMLIALPLIFAPWSLPVMLFVAAAVGYGIRQLSVRPVFSRRLPYLVALIALSALLISFMVSYALASPINCLSGTPH